MEIRKRSLPTLNEILTLEAVARLGSITAASRELGVSQPTISYHIKNLEKRWNARFFRQDGRKLQQTEYLRVLLPEITELSRRLRNLSLIAEDTSNIDTLSIALPGSLCNLVLQPSLKSLQKHMPGTRFRIRASNRFEDLDEQGIDVAIRLAPRPVEIKDHPEDRIAYPVIHERIRAVCSPAYLASLAEPLQSLIRCRDPSVFVHLAAIHEEETLYWAQFLAACGAQPRRNWQAVLSFNNADAVLSATLSGHGIALLRDLYVQRDLTSGKLAEPFDISLECPRIYRIVLSEKGQSKPAAYEFAKWFGELLARLAHSAERSKDIYK